MPAIRQQKVAPVRDAFILFVMPATLCRVLRAAACRWISRRYFDTYQMKVPRCFRYFHLFVRAASHASSSPTFSIHRNTVIHNTTLMVISPSLLFFIVIVYWFAIFPPFLRHSSPSIFSPSHIQYCRDITTHNVFIVYSALILWPLLPLSFLLPRPLHYPSSSFFTARSSEYYVNRSHEYTPSFSRHFQYYATIFQWGHRIMAIPNQQPNNTGPYSPSPPIPGLLKNIIPTPRHRHQQC